MPDDDLPTHNVTFVTPSGHEYVAEEVPEDEYLIVAASRAGLELESRCLQGWCLTCASKLLDGEIDQSEARRYFDEDEEAGFILPCSGFPRSDCRILVDQKEAMEANRDVNDLPY
ncbi:MAG: 2Fe-2S iron-sulfur cluster-binding protein [Bradymonadaceae bacterium]